MRPIHKLNNGTGATLCNECSIIISNGLTNELFCNICKTYKNLIDMMKKDEELAMYEEAFKHEIRVIPKEEILDNRASAYEFINFDKEALEEAAERYSDDWENQTGLVYEDEYPSAINKLDFINGAKWQKERSEEEIIWALLLCSNKKFKNSLEVKEWWNNFQNK